MRERTQQYVVIFMTNYYQSKPRSLAYLDQMLLRSEMLGQPRWRSRMFKEEWRCCTTKVGVLVVTVSWQRTNSEEIIQVCRNVVTASQMQSIHVGTTSMNLQEAGRPWWTPGRFMGLHGFNMVQPFSHLIQVLNQQRSRMQNQPRVKLGVVRKKRGPMHVKHQIIASFKSDQCSSLP